MSSQSIGNNQDISAWVNDYTEVLLGFAMKRLSDVQVAEDLVQETFIAAHQSIHKFQQKSSPKTWLTSILKNKIMDHYRQVYRKNETFIEGSEAFNEDGSWRMEKLPSQWEEEILLDDPEFVSTFDDCLESLPEKWNIAVRLKYLKEDHDLDSLGISKANYWKMLERARNQLRECLTVNWFDRA